MTAERSSLVHKWPPRTTTRFVCRECLPSAGGDLPHVIHMVDRFLDEFLPQRMFTAACGGGAKLETLEFLLACTVPSWHLVVNAAVRGGHLHVLQWMLSEREDGRGPWKSDFKYAPEQAAKHGNLELLAWLHEHDVGEFSTRTMDEAACSGHLNIVKWLYFNRPECRSNAAFSRAATHGRLEVLKWLVKYLPGDLPGRYEYPGDEMAFAASNGHLEAVQWLYYNQGIQASSRSLYHMEYALMKAAGSGHFNVVRWLFDRGVRPYGSQAAENAAASGNLELVNWFHEQFNDTFSPRVMEEAVKAGHLHVAKWLHENRTEGGMRGILEVAASTGRLDILEWLHGKRLQRLSSSVLHAAAIAGHLEIVRWLHQHGQKTCTDEAMIRAAVLGHVEVVRFLYDTKINQGVGRKVRDAADCGRFELIKTLDEMQGLSDLQRHFARDTIVDSALAVLDELRAGCQSAGEDRNKRTKFLEIAEWCEKHNFESCVLPMLQDALKQGFPRLVWRFFEHRSDSNFEDFVEESTRYCCDSTLMRWLVEKRPEMAAVMQAT